MQLIITGDGSHTLFVPHLNEHYHSTYGAVTESVHIFIKAGFEQLQPKENIAILETGFGTGLNALLTCLAAIDRSIKVIYHTIEKFPLDIELVSRLNYPAKIPSLNNPEKLFAAIHEAMWNTRVEIHPCFTLHKMQSDLTGFVPDFTCDLIYFDAFAPEKQPEMWTPEIFKRLFDCLNPGGIITTYCVMGEVKRMMKQAGFVIEKLPGPKGKREMLRGVKH